MNLVQLKFGIISLLIFALTACGGLGSDIEGEWRIQKINGLKVPTETADLTMSFRSNGIFTTKKGQGDEYYKQGGWSVSENGKDIEASFIEDSGKEEEFTYRNVVVEGKTLMFTDEKGINLTFVRV